MRCNAYLYLGLGNEMSDEMNAEFFSATDIVRVVNTTTSNVRIINMDTQKSADFYPQMMKDITIRIPWLYPGNDMLKNQMRALIVQLLDRNKYIYIYEEKGLIHANEAKGVYSPILGYSKANTKYGLWIRDHTVSLENPSDTYYKGGPAIKPHSIEESAFGIGQPTS